HAGDARVPAGGVLVADRERPRRVRALPASRGALGSGRARLAALLLGVMLLGLVVSGKALAGPFLFVMALFRVDGRLAAGQDPLDHGGRSDRHEEAGDAE